MQKQKDLKLNVDVHSDVPRYLIGDKQRFCQILLNLLSNANKFTEQGEITIEVKVKSRSFCPPNRTDVDGATQCELLISVTDTGIGIPRDNMHLLFKQFCQVDSSLARK